MPKIEIRCLESSLTDGKRIINQFSKKNGKTETEIITKLNDGNKNIRTIFQDTMGNIEKVVDNVFGRTETYTQAPNKPGVIQTFDDIRIYFPQISIERLAKH